MSDISSNIIQLQNQYHNFLFTQIGIQGLLPRCNQTQVSLQQILYNKSVGIDGHVLLHKFAYSSADKLVLKKDLSQIIQKYIQSMKKLSPICKQIILVFDGKSLQSKQIVNKQRSDLRHQALEQAKIQAAVGEDTTRACQSAVSFNYNDILEISQAIVETNIKNLLVLIAPYEADAQLAHLELSQVIDFVITIDSDLLLYGLKNVIYKPDFYNMTGYLITFNDIFENPKSIIQQKNIEIFRKLCILSGCDYCKSPKGIGQMKIIKMYQNGSENILDFGQLCLKSGKRDEDYESDEEYIKMLIVSLYTFKHHIVYDFYQQKCINRVPILNDDLSIKQLMEQYIGTLQENNEYDCFLNDQQRYMAKQLQQTAKQYQEKQVFDEENLKYDGEYISNKENTIKYKININNKNSREQNYTAVETDHQNNKKFDFLFRFSQRQQLQ